jgi:hypothetical protein
MKLQIFLIIAILLFPIVLASEIVNNNTVLGSEASIDWSLATTGSPTDEATLNSQIINAQSNNQISNEEVKFNLDMRNLIDLGNQAWTLIIGLFILIFETVVLLLIFFEMRLIIWVLVEILPSLILSIRNSLIKNIRRAVPK